MSWHSRRRFRCELVIFRDEVAKFIALAEARAAAASKPRSSASFRPVTESEATALVGAELLAQVAGGHRT